MRTIASTFSTRDEAERAGRRLQDFGVPTDRIQLKSDASGATVVMAKVAPEQANAATQILAGRSAAEPPSQPAAADAAPPSGGEPGHVYFGGPEGGARPLRPAPAAPQPSSPPASDEDSRWWRRFILITGVAVVLAFLIGALMGMVVPG